MIDLNGEDFRDAFPGCRQRVNSMNKGKEIGEYGKYSECMGTSMCVIMKDLGSGLTGNSARKLEEPEYVL